MKKLLLPLMLSLSVLPAYAANFTREDLVGDWQCDSRYALIKDPSKSFTVKAIVSAKPDGGYQSTQLLHWYNRKELDYVYLVRFRGQWQIHKNLLKTQYAYEDIDVWAFDYLVKSEFNDAERQNIKQKIWRNREHTASFPAVLIWQNSDQYIMDDHEDLENYYVNNPPPNKKIGKTVCRRLKS